MEIPVIQILIVIVLIFLTIVIVGILYWTTPRQTLDTPTYLNNDIKTIRDIIIKDSYLHRLLMIEIINVNPDNDKSPQSHHNLESIKSDVITFKKISDGVDLLGKSLVRSFGGTLTQHIVSLMHQRNNIILDYYKSMREIVCDNGTCVHITEIPKDLDKSQIIRPLTPTDSPFPSASINSYVKDEDIEVILGKLDVTTITLRKLETITSELTDILTTTFDIKNFPDIGGYKRLYNLLVMYDKELLNQAKSYALKQYDISMNCAQSSLDITYHISDEFTFLIHNIYKSNGDPLQTSKVV